MKRTTLLIGAFILWAILDAVRGFRANETAKFYSSHPGRLLYVLGIAAVGRVVAVLFYRLSPSGHGAPAKSRRAWHSQPFGYSIVSRFGNVPPLGLGAGVN